MKPTILNSSGAPIPRQPQVRVVERPIVAVHLQDPDGVAEITVQPDITGYEAYLIANLMAWVTTNPPAQQAENGDRILVHTMWRKYIAEHKLERHFKFSDGVPVQEAGHG